MPHLRSPESLVRRAARNYIITNSYVDPVLAESVCTRSVEQVKAYLEITFNQAVAKSAVPSVERGLVLVDSRGRGAFQKMKAKEVTE